jgi:myosin heavy subunit
MHFAPNSFVKAGTTSDSWEPRSRPVVHKICRLLETTEAKFMEVYGSFPSKLEAENRMLDLARMLYKIAFEWLNERINESLGIHTRTMVELRIETLR